VSLTPSHLYRYDLSLTVSTGGYWRFRGLVRGLASAGLLGTQPFVVSRPEGTLIGTGPDGRPVGHGPVLGRVLISIPDQHAPAVDPHRSGMPNPYAGLRDRIESVPMAPERALALAKGHLWRPGGAGRPGARHGQAFLDLQQHPFATIAVVTSPGLIKAASEVLRSASDGAWQLTEEGAPAREAVMRGFQPQYLTANFDQSSGPLGWSSTGLLGKGPYASLRADFRHFTTVDGLQALTGSVPMDSELTLGSTHQAAGKTGKATTVFFGGQASYAKPQRVGPGVMGTYGVVISPWSSSAAQSRSVVRTVLADTNRKEFGNQVLVSGTAEHWMATSSSLVGRRLTGRTFMPSALSGAAGRTTSVPGGWLGHVPEKSAHRLRLIDDGMGEVPRYTGRTWLPQPWLKHNTFGTYPVNALDPTDVLAAFERTAQRRLGLDEAGLESVRTLVTSRALRALGKEMTGVGSSTPVRTGALGWRSVRIGGRTVRARAELIPGDPVFEMLDHSTELEENRRGVETVHEGSDFTSGADLGVTVTEGTATHGQAVVAAGPAYGETGSARRTRSSGNTNTSITIHRAASTEPYAEVTTPYRLRLTLEADDDPAPRRGPSGASTSGASAGERPPRGRMAEVWRNAIGRTTITEEGDIGRVREHVPLSLMAPVRTAGMPPVDPRLSPPRLIPDPRLRLDRTARVMDPATRHGDGTLKPFTFPENGFHVRRIVGQENIQAANNAAIARSYSHGFHWDERDSLHDIVRRATDTSLTRPGSGSAQTLEDGTGNAFLTTFWDRTVTVTGYSVPGLAEKHLVGTDTAALALYSKPDFGGAVLLSVADGMKLEVLNRVTEGGGTSVARESVQDSAMGGGFLVASDALGQNQYSATMTGPYALDGDGTTVGGEHLGSINVKPKTGRTFLFAIPTTWLSVADVHRGIKDSALGAWVQGVFGHARPGRQEVGSHAYTIAWVREDIARELGMVSDRNFPGRVGKAWDAVAGSSKAWVDADKAYWAKRRTAVGLREAVDAALSGVAEARTAADATARSLSLARDAAAAADEARRAGAAEPGTRRHPADDAGPGRDVRHDPHGAAAAARPDRLAPGDSGPTRDGRPGAAPAARLGAVRAEQTEAAARQDAADMSHRAATRRLDAATARLDAARRDFSARSAELAALRGAADRAAHEYHRVRVGADELTRWHQLNATEEGRRQLDGLAEPPAVTFTPPLKPVGPAVSARPVYTRSGGTGPGAGLTSPEHVTYTLHDVGRDNSFYRALAEGLRRTDPRLAADAGVDLADPEAAVAGLRQLMTARFTDPADADLSAFVTPDATDTFTTAEIDGAGLDLGRDTPARREFDGLGGRIPHALNLGEDVRAALAAAQLRRPVDADADTGWDHSGADLLALLAARTFGARVTVVRDDGSFQDFVGFRDGPGTGDASGALAGLLDGVERTRPHIVLSLADHRYRLAVPDAAAEDTAPGGPAAPVAEVPLDPHRAADGADGFGSALVQTMRDGVFDLTRLPDGLRGVLDGGPGPVTAVDALYRWIAERATRDELSAGSPLIDDERAVSLEAFARAGVVLTETQSMRAVLEGGALPAGEVDLTMVQGLRLALTLTPRAASVMALAATVIARELGAAVVLVGPEGEAHRFGSGDAPPVVVVQENGDLVFGVPRARELSVLGR
jgi:hypothetical protein